MEFLSRCLATLETNPNFSYHPMYKRVKLTHLMFANDLLLFCRADYLSVSALMEQFQKFLSCSGLEANEDKCEICFVGVDDHVQQSICDALGMKKGSLPFRYLGVLLASRKLECGECKVLDRITKPSTHWGLGSFPMGLECV